LLAYARERIVPAMKMMPFTDSDRVGMAVFCQNWRDSIDPIESILVANPIATGVDLLH
jgi:hypothetical protein